MRNGLVALLPRERIYFVRIFSVSTVVGETLTLSKVTRSEMGTYMCIASNGVPPSVSKRMMLHVHCEYEAKIPISIQFKPPKNLKKSIFIHAISHNLAF